MTASGLPLRVLLALLFLVPVACTHKPPQAPAADAVQPPDGKWLTDEEGKKYFVERLPLRQVVRIDAKTVRSIWGMPLELVREDDEYAYFKVYKTETVPYVDDSIPSPEALKAVAASYAVDVKRSTRLRFAPFGDGLPQAGQWREGFAIGDMNEDGHPDIVHGPARKMMGGPVIFLGDGKGHWQRWKDAQFPSLPYDYGDARVGDLDNDGHLDVVFAVHLRGLTALVGDGHGRFQAASDGLQLTLRGGAGDEALFSSRAIRLADWDRDGRLDLIALGEGPIVNMSRGGGGKSDSARGVALYRNGEGLRWTRMPDAAGRDGIFGDALAVADFNGDKRVDFATASGIMGRRDIVGIQRADGGWDPLEIEGLRPASYVKAVAAADFDGDGLDDLAVSYQSFELAVWRVGIDVFFASPSGAWRRRALLAREGRATFDALAAGDVDADGRRDLVALSSSGAVTIFLGDGRGSFTREAPLASPFGCRGVHAELADLDGLPGDEIVASFGEERDDEGEAACSSEGGIAGWKKIDK